MEQTELETLIADVEVAIERLRSLYDQYFMGIEKIEPAVARKDVDRRIYVLRKEHIRNTALRFRFQMVLQRYNTFQSHWQRICREIENGTYKRHLVRAEQRFGKETRRRSTIPPAKSDAPTAVPPASAVPVTVPRNAALPPVAALPLAAVTSPPTFPPAAAVPPPATAAAPPPGALSTPGAVAPAAAFPVAAAPRLPPNAPISRQAALRPAVRSPSAVATAAVPSPAGGAQLGANPPPALQRPTALTLPAGAMQKPAPLTLPAGAIQRPAAFPQPAAPQQPSPPANAPSPPSAVGPKARPAQAPPPKPGPGARSPADLAAELAELDREFAPAPGSLLEDARRKENARRSLGSPKGPVVPAPNTGTMQRPPEAAKPPTAPPRPPSGAAKPPTPPPRPPPAAPAAAQPATAPPRSAGTVPKPATQRPARPQQTAARAHQPGREEGLSDNRVRQLYSEYVEAKRRQNESTASITYEVVAQSLRDSSARLRQKHGKAVDFEIAIRNGKAFLRPIVK